MKLHASILGVALLVASSVVLAKSITVKIEIAGPGLAQSLEITDPEILRKFSIWNGPRVSVSNGRSVSSGAFIDWSHEAVDKPDHVQRYTVTFHQGGRPGMHEWHRRYIVTYAYASDTGAGYIYLPGPGDGDVFRRNTFSIAHGVEGNWFRASDAWQKTVLPLLQEVTAVSRDRHLGSKTFGKEGRIRRTQVGELGRGSN